MCCNSAPNLRQMTGFGGCYEYRIGVPAGRDLRGILMRVRSFCVGSMALDVQEGYRFLRKFEDFGVRRGVKNSIFGGEALFLGEKRGFWGRKWTRGEIGLLLKKRIKCFCNKGLRW